MLMTKPNRTMQSVMTMAVLMTGLFFLGAGPAKAQEVCKSVAEIKTEFKAVIMPAEEQQKQRICWLKKYMTGERDLRGAFFYDFNYAFDGHPYGFSGADFKGRDLSYASLVGATLVSTDFTGATLTETDFTSANLSGAIFIGADLSGAKINPPIVSSKRTVEDVALQEIMGLMRALNALNTVTLTGAIVSRSTTKGVDFDLWVKKGGVVVD